MPKETRRRPRRVRMSAEQRAQWARERRELVGSVITQEEFRGAFVVAVSYTHLRAHET